jgi:hypothetical protein
MSLIKPNSLKNINELIILLTSVLYAGISSNVFLGFRVVDFLIIIFFTLKIRVRTDKNIFTFFTLWIISIIISTILGVFYKAPFILSDFRFFLTFALAGYVGYSVGISSSFNIEKLFYKLMFITLLVYCIIPFIDFIRFYYIPESFQKEEHSKTIFGPSTIIINYLFIYLVLINRIRPLKFYITYVAFALVIYYFRISRTDLAIMLLLLFWSVAYRFGDKIKVKHIALGTIFGVGLSLFFIFNNNERIKGMFNPSEDTSFVYRILSNGAFMDQYEEANVLIKTFGFGIGSVINTHFNDWFGDIRLTILDNLPLTIMMKTGMFGLIVFLFILFYPLKGMKFKVSIILLFPILLSAALFSHVIYNLLYIFGFYFICFKLKKIRI